MMTKWQPDGERPVKPGQRSRSRLLAAAKWTVLVSVAALALTALVALQRDAASAATFDPTLDVTLSDSTAGANADVANAFAVPAPDANYDVLITFTPPEFGMGSEDIPLGAHVADLQSDSTLGLLNGVCITALPVDFEMLKATTDTTDTISFDDGFADLDGNTLPDAVDKYPDFLNTMYPGLTPIARSYGQQSVAGTPVSMNQVVFAPGTLFPGMPAFDASLGYGVVSVLNDPTAEFAPGSITDWCTPVANATTVFGITKDNPATAADESGYVGSTNPTTGGDYTFTSYARSIPDADNDGIENDLDTCPFDVNEGDPRVQGSGDNDNDGIDNACDPTPDEDTGGGDHDGDVYLNRGDNCPLVNNPDNLDSDGDRIGDLCDLHPDTPDGVSIEVYLTDTVTIVGGAPTIVRVDQGISVEALGVPSPGVGAFTINATYNPSTLTPLECSVDPAFDMGVCNPAAGPNTIVATGIEAECGLTGRVPLATMPFEPTPPVCPGDLVVSMETFASCEGADMPVIVDDKWWVGDADRDFDKDAVDALFILQYVVGLRGGSDQCPPPPGAIYLPGADADCDGDVDAVDALFVLQHVVGLRPVLCPGGPLKVGTLFDYTGDLAEFGPPIRNGADLAASHVNSAGGVLGQVLQLIHKDSGASPEIGVSEALTLVDVYGVPAITGALASGVTVPVAEGVTIPKRVVLISPASTSPAITTLDDNDYVFRTVMSDASQGMVLASLAQEQGFGTAATLYLNNAYGQGISDEFTAAFEGLGGVVTATVPYEEGQVTCQDELLEATAGNPDVLVAILYPNEAIVCLSEAIDGGYIDTFLLTDGAKSQDVIDGVEAAVGSGALDGTYGTEPAAMETEGSAIFNASYEAEYGEPPPFPYVNTAYDAVALLTLAAEKAGSTNSAAICDALRDVANPPGEIVWPGSAGIEQALQLVRSGQDVNYEGASGPVDLDENGDVTCGAVQVWKIEGGAFINVRVEIVGPCGP